MKRRILCALFAMPFSVLCASWKWNGTISVEVCSFTEFTVIERGIENSSDDCPDDTRSYFTGHSFLLFYNMTNSVQTVGHFSLAPYCRVSVGLWSAGASGGSSSGSSNGGSSSGSSNGTGYSGVYYNRELYYYTQCETITNIARYEVTLTSSKLAQISSILVNKNDTYNLLTYNCANLATDIWNIADDQNWWSFGTRLPSHVRNDIISTYPDGYSSNNYFVPSASFQHYDSSLEEWVTVTP